jgi:hypothetical protein
MVILKCSVSGLAVVWSEKSEVDVYVQHPPPVGGHRLLLPIGRTNITSESNFARRDAFESGVRVGIPFYRKAPAGVSRTPLRPSLRALVRPRATHS